MSSCALEVLRMTGVAAPKIFPNIRAWQLGSRAVAGLRCRRAPTRDGTRDPRRKTVDRPGLRH
eukprot:8079032-Alexandrium_andersonii.AAC.1